MGVKRLPSCAASTDACCNAPFNPARAATRQTGTDSDRVAPSGAEIGAFNAEGA